MVKLKDIAAQAGVSVMTVSKALRDEHDISAVTKTRLKLLAQQLGYVPDSGARQLRTRKTRLFGVVVSSVATPILSRVVLAIEEHAYQLGYDVVIAQTLDKPEREEACISRLMARRVDGLFIVPAYRMATEARAYQELLMRRVPTVVLGHTAAFCKEFISVETDDIQASCVATRHLLELGHTRIAFISGPAALPSTTERLEGYRRALREANMDVDDRLVFQADGAVEDGAATTLQMINERTDATAIQAVNDFTAIGCVETLLKQGVRVPADMSVVGFGDILICRHFRVPLTTLNQPKYRLGAAAVESMQQLLRGKPAETKRLPAELVVRESSGTPPATPVLQHLKTTGTEASL
jgi:DNA-binding LacI/PurR family transcriptional regulator